MRTKQLKALMYDVQYQDYAPDLSMYTALLDKRMPVIEFGSGTGRIARYLLGNGYTVYGIEKDTAYREVLLEKISGESYASNFSFLSDIRDAGELCNIIYPFNVLFYLDKRQLHEECQKWTSALWSTLILETDNIHATSYSMVQEKIHKHGIFTFKESTLKENGKMMIRNKIMQYNRELVAFDYPMYLHEASFLLSLYETYLPVKRLYDGFELKAYHQRAQKLVVVASNPLAQV